MYPIILFALGLEVFVMGRKNSPKFNTKIRQCTSDILAMAKNDLNLSDVLDKKFVLYYSSYPIIGRCAYVTFTQDDYGNPVLSMTGAKDPVFDTPLSLRDINDGVYPATGPSYTHPNGNVWPFYSKVVVTGYDQFTGVLSYIHCSDDGTDTIDQRFILIRSDKLGDRSAQLETLWVYINDKGKVLKKTLKGDLIQVNHDCSRKH